MITIKDLNFSYPKKPALCEELNLELEPGKIIGLLGMNGVGKTTLMRLMAGLLKPSSGEVLSDGIPTFSRKVNFLDQMIFVPEKVTVPEFLKIDAYIGIYGSFYSRFDFDHLDRLLAEFQITRSQKVSSLSMGQQKKLQIAIGLSTRAKLLLFDEPTNGLDIPSKSKLRKVLSGNLQDDQTIVISTHQVKDIENLVDQVIILHDRQIMLHADLEVLEEEFIFDQSVQAPDKSVFQDSHFLGVQYIAKKSKDNAINGGKPDLELLFNAVTSGSLSGVYLTEQKQK